MKINMGITKTEIALAIFTVILVTLLIVGGHNEYTKLKPEFMNQCKQDGCKPTECEVMYRQSKGTIY